MTKLVITLTLFALVLNGINGEAFLFFPRPMLPPAEKTFTFTFQGHMMDLAVSGVYALQAVLGADMKTVIGYRNWQSYTGGYSGTFYGVSYFNGTYPQALIDADTQQCTNIFSEALDCTSWRNTEIVKWDSRCSIVRADPPITGEMVMSLRASTSELTRPLNFTGTVTIDGSPDKMTIAYDFLSKTDQKNFPTVHCPF